MKTPAEMVLEVLNEIVDIVLESEDKNTDHNEIVTNQLLQRNIHKLHKQVFVKVKVNENQVNPPSVMASADFKSIKAFKAKQSQQKFGKPAEPHNSKSFRSTVQGRKSNFAQKKQARLSVQPQSTLMQTTRNLHSHTN